MTITVNDEVLPLGDVASVHELLESLDLAEKTGIAVAVNDAVVSRAGWAGFVLRDTDRVTIIQATQGG